MAKTLSIIDILEENLNINKENELLQKEIDYLVKQNAVLEVENIQLKRYRELYSQYVLWKEW